MSPARRRRCVDHVMAKFSVSERFACKVLGQHRSTHRKKPKGRPDEEALTADIIRLASRYGRYGYRRITAMLRSEGWTVNAKRVERIWRREGLKVPQKQPKRGRLWLNDGSCVRLRPEHPNHVWSYDFVEGRTHDGRKFRMLAWRSALIASSVSARAMGSRERYRTPRPARGDDLGHALPGRGSSDAGRRRPHRGRPLARFPPGRR